jgi:hypothetical protein
VASSEGVRFSLEEILTLVEDLMRVADELLLVDQVVNQLLTRAFGAD